MIGDIGMDNVTIHLDTYHMNIEENSMEQAIQAAGDKLGCISRALCQTLTRPSSSIQIHTQQLLCITFAPLINK